MNEEEAFEAGRVRGRSEGIVEGGANRTEVQLAHLDKLNAEAQIQPLRQRIKDLEEENAELKQRLREYEERFAVLKERGMEKDEYDDRE